MPGVWSRGTFGLRLGTTRRRRTGERSTLLRGDDGERSLAGGDLNDGSAQALALSFCSWSSSNLFKAFGAALNGTGAAGCVDDPTSCIRLGSSCAFTSRSQRRRPEGQQLDLACRL
mmetsp:Transcript_28049/g.65519  ORF Transcript_28049/g.65519 Transcript_28049/m.65519 type:complete len:116 (+) Transcript_28049:496-843(+)